MSLLEVDDLVVQFDAGDSPVHAVNGVSFSVEEGETVALVGESGCGKTITALSLVGLVPSPPGRRVRGAIRFRGAALHGGDDAATRACRGRDIAYIFQDPSTALNPVLRIGFQVKESVRLHRPDADASSVSLDLMRLVGMPDPDVVMRAYPHELSGGMKQRVVIAMALASQPALLVADEPTTALDVTIQAQILDQLRHLKESLDLSLLLITHNLGIVAGMADRVCVMYAGRIVEQGPVRDVLRNSAHPYTRGLLAAVPRLAGASNAGTMGVGIPGSVLDPRRLPAGCLFAPRCPKASDVCLSSDPPKRQLAAGHEVHCHFPEGPGA